MAETENLEAMGQLWLWQPSMGLSCLPFFPQERDAHGPSFIILIIIIKLYTDLESWYCGLATVPFVLLQTWYLQTLPHFPNCCLSVLSSETHIFPFMFLLIFICVYLLMPISLYILILHICVWEILANLGDMDIKYVCNCIYESIRYFFPPCRKEWLGKDWAYE